MRHLLISALFSVVSLVADTSSDFLLSSLAWSDRYWDEQAGFVRSLDGSSRHLVRETSWYALGLLQRDRAGDRPRAVKALEAVLSKQFHERDERWDGTFYRAPEEPHPTPLAEMWRNYDPNWREFIGATFALVLFNHRKQIPPQLATRLEASILSAIAGEIHERRLSTRYTNISLMYGFLWNYGATSLGRKDWIGPSEEWIDIVYRQFKEYGAFDEFNSPTYYGVDLYGLALWRVHGSTTAVREKGAEMETGLWRSIASFYNAGLKNIAGPYDRSYGMDMHKYVNLAGLWMRTLLEEDQAPFPPLKEPLEHGNDLLFAPCVVSLGAIIPAEALAALRKFPGEHQVKQELPGNRVATAWIGERLMLGAEFTGGTRDAGSPGNQFHPATIHWRMPDGDIGWVRLIQCPRVDAKAARNVLTITTTRGDSRFRVFAPPHDRNIAALAVKLTNSSWKLPGLTVSVDTDATGFDAEHDGDYLVITYRNATRLRLIADLESARVN
jgi:hypothetical protein